jgi:hypothetical protein
MGLLAFLLYDETDDGPEMKVRTSSASRKSTSTLPDATTSSTRLFSTCLLVSPTTASRKPRGGSFFLEYTLSTALDQ